MTERVFVLPPGSRIGPISDAERRKVIEASTVFGHYEKTADRESAYEKLKSRTEEKHQESPKTKTDSNPVSDILFGERCFARQYHGSRLWRNPRAT